MKVLFVSRDLSGGDLCYRLKEEGHAVKLFIQDEKQRCNLEGLVEKTSDWKRELGWVGKSGLIVFDSTGYGRDQDRLRRAGYSVVGGSALGDKIEDQRHFGKKVMEQCGIRTLPSETFRSLDEAIRFVQREKGEWVVKQNGHVSKIFNYVGQMEDGSDVVEILKTYRENNSGDAHVIELQKRARGVEIGVARYFNGHDWVGPIEMNVEHKSLFSGGLGPKTDEMGTLMWYDPNDRNRFFVETLSRMKPYLQEINFRGDIDINCIVNKSGIYPLEVTARFGSPSTQLQSALHISPWGEFLKAIANGEAYDLKYRNGFGIIVLIATPPFPYMAISKRYSMQGTGIFFSEKLSQGEKSRIHFEEISKREDGSLYISGTRGFVLDVSGVGVSIEEARKKAYALAEKVIIPKKFYRTDIGMKFLEKEKALLEEWGWLSSKKSQR